MQAYHTSTGIGNEGKVELTLPFKKGEKVAVIVMPYDEAASQAHEDADWMRLGMQHFFVDDAETDSAYDAL
jgi:hypothetical protein